jgi:hypothetical protein
MLFDSCMIVGLADVGEEAATRIVSLTVGVLAVIGAGSSVRLLWRRRKTKAERWDAAMRQAGWDVEALRARWGADAERMLPGRVNLDD